MGPPNKNLQFLRPLFTLTCIFCAFPLFRIKNLQSSRGRLLKKFNIILALSSVVLWSLVGVEAIYKDSLIMNEINKKAQIGLMPVTIMSLIVQCVLAIFSISIVISFGFIYRESIHELFKKLDRVDFILDFKLGKTSWQLYLQSLVFCILQLIHGYYYYSLWKPLWGDSFVHIYIIRIMQMFQFSLVVFTINTLCLHLYQRFKKLNSLLKELDPHHHALLQDERRIHIINEQHKYVVFKELKKIHSVLCDQIDNINDIFGFILLCFIITAITMMCYFVLHLLTMIMVDVNLNQTQNLQWLIICCSGMLFITLKVVSLAWIGALLSSETGQTHKIAYDLLNLLPHQNQKGVNQLFRKEVKMLAIQSGFRQPFISTRGIFKVDFGILGAVIDSVTSYIIVAEQLLK